MQWSGESAHCFGQQCVHVPTTHNLAMQSCLAARTNGVGTHAGAVYFSTNIFL